MEVSYKKLWKLLIDREMTRTDLRLAARISTYTLARLGKKSGSHPDHPPENHCCAGLFA